MASIMYNEGNQSIIDRDIDLAANTIKAMLVNSTYTPDKDDQFIDTGGASDAVDARLSGTTDQTLANKALGKDTTSDFAYFDADDVVFTAVTTGQTAVGVVIYKDTGTPTTSKLIAYLDITDTPTNGGDITIQFAAPASGGIFKLNT
jgi:hypothetical protein